MFLGIGLSGLILSIQRTPSMMFSITRYGQACRKSQPNSHCCREMANSAESKLGWVRLVASSTLSSAGMGRCWPLFILTWLNLPEYEGAGCCLREKEHSPVWSSYQVLDILLAKHSYILQKKQCPQCLQNIPIILMVPYSFQTSGSWLRQ